jgi:hypothetical protein
VPACGAIDLDEIARPEILDAGRLERNHPRPHLVLVRHRTARAEPAFCSTLFTTSISISVVWKSAVVDLLTSWATIACRLVVVAPAPVGRGERRRVQRGDQQRRQVLAARAARVAGLSLLETPARRRLGDESEATPTSPRASIAAADDAAGGRPRPIPTTRVYRGAVSGLASRGARGWTVKENSTS